MTEAPQRVVAHSIREILRERNVTSVAMIDDAFDPPRVEELDLDAIARFHYVVSDSDEMRQVVEQLGIDPDSLSDLTDEHLVLLHQASDGLGPVAPEWEVLAGGLVREKLALVEPLRTMLQEDLGLDVQALGVEAAEEFELGSASIVFVDYIMGGTVEGPVRARALIAELIDRHREAGAMLPLIVLMSSKNLATAVIDEFRETTGVLGGLYQFIPKEQLLRPEILRLRLGVLAESIPNARRLQAFTDAIDHSLKGIRDRFMDTVRALTLEDYAYIQMLALQGDGHPLGDYMIWLFTAVLGDLAFGEEAVVEQQQLIDAMTFTAFAPRQHGPSAVLAEMYHRAQFSNVDDVGHHPRQPDGVPAKREEVYVHMGDVFARPDGDEMWVLITAECDLAFAPGNDDRPFHGERSAQLLPGTREELGQPLTTSDRGGLRTEIYRDVGKSYRINWDPKRLRAFPLNELREWLDGGWIRKYRLRQPFALELQRGFASDSGRVGMPVPPPFYQPLRAQILTRGVEGRIEYLTECVDGEVITFVAGEQSYYVFTDAFVQRIMEAAGRATAMLRKELDLALGGDQSQQKRRDRLQHRIEVLEAHAMDVRSLLRLHGKHQTSGKSGAHFEISKLLTLHPGIIGSEQYQFRTPLAVQVSPVLEEEVAVGEDQGGEGEISEPIAEGNSAGSDIAPGTGS